jgi:hypothetical protein
MLKKFLALSMILGSMVFTVSTAEAKTSTANAAASVELNAAPQWQNNQNRRWRNNNRRARVYTRTRIVRIGGRYYREVWQYRVLPNGRTNTRLLSRTRIYR